MDNSTPGQPHIDLVNKEVATVFSSSSFEGPAITESEIFQAQRDWAKGIEEIGALFLSGDDYVNRAHKLIDRLYGYGEGPVLFKPTLAATHPFRFEKSEANSYFIGGAINEDLGFAIRPWEHVQFGSQQIRLQDLTAMAMGHYHFTEYNSSDVTTVEFSFGYYRSNDGSVRINLHHSSLPHT